MYEVTVTYRSGSVVTNTAESKYEALDRVRYALESVYTVDVTVVPVPL